MKERKIKTVAHPTKETTFRFLVDILFEECSKVIYIDCDTIVNVDIALLYRENIDGCILGAVLGNLNSFHVEYIVDNLECDVDKYFNAGVLLIDIPMFKKYEIRKKGFELLESGRHFSMLDQDILNILCKDKVKLLDGKWNVEWGHVVEEYIEKTWTPFINKARENKINDIDNPYIVHYTTPKKPWDNPEIKLAEYFWNNAKETCFYTEIVKNNMKKRKEKKEENPFGRYIFPWKAVNCESDILIYGAGGVGRAFLKQLSMSLYANPIAVIDRNYENIKDLSLPIISIEDIFKFEFENIIIAIEREDIANDIIKDLIARGIDESKIYWDAYNRQ